MTGRSTTRIAGRRLYRAAALAVAVLYAWLAIPAHASGLDTSSWLRTAGNEPTVSLTRLASAETAHGGGPVLMGLEIVLAPGWKTYWRAPGDSGIAPHFDWTRSENLAGVDMRWPVPQRFDAPGDVTFGYTRHIVFPLLVRAADPAKPVKLRLALDYGVCLDICIPMHEELAFDLPAGFPLPTEDAPLLQAFLRRVPHEPASPSAVETALRAGPSGRYLEVVLRKPAIGAAPVLPDLVLEGPAGLYFGKPDVRRGDDRLLYSVPVQLDSGSFEGAAVTFTFAGPDTALEVTRTLN